MLKGISPLLSPDLLRVLAQMGHGNRILLADAHFPGHSLGPQVLRADGLLIAPLLNAITPLLYLEDKSNPLAMMAVDAGDVSDAAMQAEYLQAVHRFQPGLAAPLRLQRDDFYQAGRNCFAIVLTGDTRPYGNLMLTKGVTPVDIQR